MKNNLLIMIENLKLCVRICHQSRNGSSFFEISGDNVSESGYSVKLEVSPGLPIYGKNGAGIFFYESLYQSIDLNHL
jgi:hypothetical protein